MPSLRDIINKSKGLQNAEKKQEPAPQKAAEKQKTKIPISGNKDATETIPPGGNSVVEQGPPEGLSGVALLRWRNEQKAKKNAEISHSGAGTGQKSDGANPERAGNAGAKEEAKAQPSAPQQTKQASASQAADALKANDGEIKVEELRANLAYLANNIEQKELVGKVVRTIAEQLHANHDLWPYMKDSDVDLVVRGLRSSYTHAVRKKQEKTEKKTKNSAQYDELKGVFNDLGLNLK